MAEITMEELYQNIVELSSKLNAIEDLISSSINKEVDAYKIKQFIENYQIVNDMIKEDNLNKIRASVESINNSLKLAEEIVKMPLEVIKDEAANIMGLYAEDTTQLAFNIKDVKRFKTEIYKSVKDLMNAIASLQIDKKIHEIESKAAVLDTAIKDVLAQRDKINTIIEKNEEQDILLSRIEAVNRQQDQRLEELNNISITMEKQIEDYAFYSDEFNKLLNKSKDFIETLSQLQREVYEIVKRDKMIKDLLDRVVAFIVVNMSPVLNANKILKDEIIKNRQQIAEWINYSIAFNNETRAYNLALNAYRDKIEEQIDRVYKLQDKCNQLDITSGN